MGEKPKMSLTFRVDSGVLDHNNRTFKAKNVDAAWTSDNITYKSENIQEMYHELFDAALEEYNVRKRSNEKIGDYYEHIRNGKQEQPFYEVVVQFGDITSCGLKSGNWETARQMLDEYMQPFEERNKNMKVFNAVLHLDEATPHLHIDFVPICTNQSRGLSTRVSLKRALAEQGITASSRKKTEWAVWKDNEFEYMTEILRKHGFERDIKNAHHKHLSVDDYKAKAARQEEIRKINAHINELKKRSPTELTANDFEQLNNQNDYIRKVVVEQGNMLNELSLKLKARFIPFEVFSEDKLQFIAAELSRLNVPFVEESNTLYIPDYAEKTAAAFSDSFRANNDESIREKIKFDIDRLVYWSVDFEDFLRNLEEHGYEIKYGKYIAVKPEFGERYMRLKTLGAAYFHKNLEQRIAERDNFPNDVHKKFATATTIEKTFHIAVLNVMTEVKAFRIKPKKFDDTKIYAFLNDTNINHLSEQLITISKFGICSREQMHNKAAELQDYIAKNENCNTEREQLRRISELIKTYEQIVDGNYIDNLIKAQQEEIQARDRTKKFGGRR